MRFDLNRFRQNPKHNFVLGYVIWYCATNISPNRPVALSQVTVLRPLKKTKNIDPTRISYFTHPSELICLFLDDALADMKLPWLRPS